MEKEIILHSRSRGKQPDATLTEAPELRAHINDRTVRIVHFLELPALGFITFLMVFRPF
jgi:hypothetical protein